MAEDTAKSTTDKTDAPKKPSDRTILRPYPKVIYFWLTWLFSLICGVVVALSSAEPGASAEEIAKAMSVQRTWTFIFVWVLTLNIIVVSFEFSRMLSVSLIFFFVAFLSLGAWAGFLDSVWRFFGDLTPRANHHFFFFIFAVFTIIYLLVFIQTRFNYWIVRRNELLHKHGFLGDVKRYQAQHVKIDKEIPDVLEWVLCGAGRMIIHSEHEQRAIVLDNILRINKREDDVKRILESYAVRLEKD